MEIPTPTDALLCGVATALARPVALDPRALDGVRGAAAFYMRSADGAAGGPEAPFVRDGAVAVVEVRGPLAQRAWSCMGLFGGDGYDSIERRARAAFADAGVRAVVLALDSPGGEVAGVADCADALRAMADAAGKPFVAVACEVMCSGAYWLAAAADEILVPATGVTASIGVITVVGDRVAANEARGVNVRVVRSGVRKAVPHPDEPLTSAAVAHVQADVDALARVFAEHVAARRRLTPDAVLGLDAAALLGPDAVRAGVADRLGNLADAVARAAELATTRKDKTAMKTVISALALPEGAAEAEAEALAAVHGLQATARDHAKVLAAVGATTTDAALGTIDALVVADRELTALRKAEAAAAATREKTEREELVATGTREGQLAAHDLETWVPEASTTRLKAFLAKAPRRARAATDRVDPPTDGEAPAPGAVTTADGKRWEQLTSKEKRALRASNRALYDALLADADARGARG